VTACGLPACENRSPHSNVSVASSRDEHHSDPMARLLARWRTGIQGNPARSAGSPANWRPADDAGGCQNGTRTTSMKTIPPADRPVSTAERSERGRVRIGEPVDSPGPDGLDQLVISRAQTAHSTSLCCWRTQRSVPFFRSGDRSVGVRSAEAAARRRSPGPVGPPKVMSSASAGRARSTRPRCWAVRTTLPLGGHQAPGWRSCCRTAARRASPTARAPAQRRRDR
jgi:hypothetical protein